MGFSNKKYVDQDLQKNRLLNAGLNPMTTAQRNVVAATLGNSDASFFVYDTDLKEPFFWNGSAFVGITGGVPWGNIIGNLSNQADLVAALALKANQADLSSLTSSLKTVAFSALYSDLIGVPTKLSQFTNDAGYLTSAYYQYVYAVGSIIPVTQHSKLGFTDQFAITDNSGNDSTDISIASLDYSLVTNAPTKLSQFTNDPGFLTGVTSVEIISALGYTPIDPSGNTSQYFRGDGSLATFPTTVSSFTNDAGYLTAITYGQVIGALGYTPIDPSGNTSQYFRGDGSLATFPTLLSDFTNDPGYITGVTSLQITGALGYIPIDPSGTSAQYIRGDGSMATLPAAGVASVINTDGTLTISPTGGTVVASLNLAHANIWTAEQTVNLVNLGATGTTAILLENTTLGTSLVPYQYSPGLEFIANTWSSNSATNYISGFRIYAKGVQTTFPYPQLVFQSALATSGGLTYTDTGASIGYDGVIHTTTGFNGTGGDYYFNATSGVVQFLKNGGLLMYGNNDLYGMRLYGTQNTLLPTLGVAIGSYFNLSGNYSGYRGVQIASYYSLNISNAPVICAALQVDSTTKGYLPPRMTTVQRSAIPSPLAGLEVYNSGIYTKDVYDGTDWVHVKYAKYKQVNTTYTVLITDETIDCTGGTFVVTLLSAVNIDGREYIIKNTGTGTITINTTSSQTIDQYSSGGITLTQWQSLRVKSTGTNWIII